MQPRTRLHFAQGCPPGPQNDFAQLPIEQSSWFSPPIRSPAFEIKDMNCMSPRHEPPFIKSFVAASEPNLKNGTGGVANSIWSNGDEKVQAPEQ